MTDYCCDLGDLLTDGLDANAGLLVTRAFSSLWHGTAPHPADVAHDVDPAEASEVFRRLASVGRCELGRDGRIVGVHGITQRTTPHQVIHSRGRHHSWCAFDAVGIPIALGIDATAETACPRCDTPITIRIVGGDPHDDDARVVWIPSDPGEHLIADFCSKSNLFCSADHLNSWLAEHPSDGLMLALTATADLARLTWADVADVATTGEPPPSSRLSPTV